MGKNVPDGWNIRRLDEVSDIDVQSLGCGTPCDYGFSYISLSSVNKGRISNKLPWLLYREAPSRARRIVKGNDILFPTVRPNLEGFARLPNECSDIIASTGFSVISTKSCLDSEYTYHYMFSSHIRRQVYSLVCGSNYPSINSKDVGAMRILLPPLPEQKAIANILSTWHKAIDALERLIKIKGIELAHVSKALLFGRQRLCGVVSRMCNVANIEHPSDWLLVPIRKIAKEVNTRNSESNTTVLSCSKYDGFVNSLDYFGKQVFSDNTSNYKMIMKGQFAYPANHIEEGSIGLLQHCSMGILSPIYVVFEVSDNEVYAPFLYQLLKTDTYKHIFRVETSSSVDRRGSLRWKAFSSIKVALPPIVEQREIAESISTKQKEIDLLKEVLQKYKTQKRGLMQQLLTGKCRVSLNILDE